MEPIFRLFVLLTVLRSSLGQESLIKITTSTHYKNLKLVSDASHVVLSTRVFPVSHSLISTTQSCVEYCFKNTDCQAFNVYSNETHHSCEVLADNLCSSSLGRLALVIWPGGSVWDKINRETNLSCIDQHFDFLPQDEWCNAVRPGCSGTWPDCNNCVQSCLDCAKLYTLSESYNCTLWPGGTETSPIFARCVGNMTILMERIVHPKLPFPPFDYMMSFPDMNRLIELKVYNSLFFMFLTESLIESFTGHLMNPYITANGTLSKTDVPRQADADPDGDALVTASAPFVWVDKDQDIESCGSMWRFHPNNAPHCPGGGISMFGKVKRRSSGRVTNTGIHFPTVRDKILTFGSVALYNY